MSTTEVKKPTYLELISKDEKTVQKENLKIKAQEAALSVARDILSLNAEISLANSEVDKAQRAIPYSVATEYKAVNKLEELTARLEFATGIKDSRFTDATI